MRKVTLVIVAVTLLTLISTLLIILVEPSNHPIGLPSPVEAREISVPELASRINSFTLSLYGELLKESWNRNVIVSPFNVYIALTLLYEGANGSTRTEMGKALNLTGISSYNAYRRLLDFLPLNSSDETALIIANAIWLRQGFLFKTGYAEEVAKYYGAETNYFSNVNPS